MGARGSSATAALAWALAGSVAAGAAGCGAGERQDVDEPRGQYKLDVVAASFEREQSLGQRATLRVRVANAGARTVPAVALTVKTRSRRPGEAPAAFGQAVDDGRLADRERPVWIVDSGPAGAESAYTNTWALGRLAPRQTRSFAFRVTAVEPGAYSVAYEVAPGLDGRARLARGSKASGTLKVSIRSQPADARVRDDGRVVRVGGGSDPGSDRVR